MPTILTSTHERKTDMARGKSTSYKSKATHARELILQSEEAGAQSLEFLASAKRLIPICSENLTQALMRSQDTLMEAKEDTWLHYFAPELKAISKETASTRGSIVDKSERIVSVIHFLLAMIESQELIIDELSTSMSNMEGQISTVIADIDRNEVLGGTIPSGSHERTLGSELGEQSGAKHETRGVDNQGSPPSETFSDLNLQDKFKRPDLKGKKRDL